VRPDYQTSPLLWLSGQLGRFLGDGYREIRGLIANTLWIRAQDLQFEEKYFEMVQLSDIDARARLIAAFARSLSPETKFVR